jgi:type I restriction enzyme S subunit
VASFHNRYSCAGPGVVVGRKGTVGSVHFIETDFWAHDTTLWVQAFNGNDPRFVYFVLRTLDLKRFDTGSSNPTLNRNIVHPEVVAFPPPQEQRAIAEQLDREIASLDRRVELCMAEVTLLREYRTRLIADVVTGKLDVRGVELPELEATEANESLMM